MYLNNFTQKLDFYVLWFRRTRAYKILEEKKGKKRKKKGKKKEKKEKKEKKMKKIRKKPHRGRKWVGRDERIS